MSNSVNLSLDITKTGIQNPLIKVRQGDGGFETLHTTVTANGEPMDLQGWTITFMGTTAGNHKIVDTNVKMVEAPNGIFDYTPNKAWGMDVGEFKVAYFKFVKGDGTASSANFRVNVIEAVDLTQEEAQHYISVVDATIAEVNNHLNTVSNNVTTLGNRVNDYNSKLAALQVGGRNLLLGTQSLTGSQWTLNGALNGLYKNAAILETTTSGSIFAYNKTELVLSNKISTSDKFIISMYINNNSGSDVTITRASGSVNDGGQVIATVSSGSGWQRVSAPMSFWTLTGNPMIGLNIQGVGSQGKVLSSMPKLELGNVATDWTPAPEDVPMGLTVGGRNLLLDTGRVFTGVGNGSVNGNLDAQGGVYYLAGGKKVSDLYNQYGPTGYLTLSFDWVASGSTISGAFNPQWSAAPWEGGLGVAGGIKPSDTNKSGHHEATVPLNSSGYATSTATFVRFRQDNLQGNIAIRNLKLEAGNVATDWTPAPEDAENAYVKKSGDTMTGGLKGGQVILPDAGDLNTLTDTGKYYQVKTANATKWSNRPSNAPDFAFSVDVIGNESRALVTQTYYVHTTSRAWVRTLWLDGSAMTASAWVELANDANVVHKTGDTMTGSLQIGGKAGSGETGTLVTEKGSIELSANTAFIDFHGGNDTGDYSSRMYDSGDGLGSKIVNKSGFGIIPTPLLASDKNKYNLDTVAYGSNVLTRYSHKVIISTRTDLLGKSPYTQDGDGVTNVLGNAVVTWERGATEKYGVQTIANLWDTMIWQRVMRNGVWQPWSKVADDNSVVHKTGNETIAGDKTFTGKIGFSGAVANPVVSRTVSGTNGMSFKFRRTGNAVHVEISGNYTGTNWTGSSSPSYAAELFNVVVPAGFAPDDWSQSAIIEYGSAVGFGRYGYDSSSRKMTFTYRGMVGGVGSSKWIVSSTTYTTSDALPG